MTGIGFSCVCLLPDSGDRSAASTVEEGAGQLGSVEITIQVHQTDTLMSLTREAAMALDLMGIAALISSAKELLPALGAGWSGEPEGDPTQQKIKQVTADNYDQYRRSVDDGCMRILVHLRDGRNCQPKFLIQEVHPKCVNMRESEKDILLEEFLWRLAFMESSGLLSSVVGGKYMISHLGQGFVRVATDRRDYHYILFR